MRRFMQSGTLAATAGLLWAGVVFGGDKAPNDASQKIDAPKQNVSVAAHQESGEQHLGKMSRKDYTPELKRVSTLANLKVVTKQGETFGTVEDVIIDVSHGRVAYAVISHGGFLGIGDKDVLLPFTTIKAKNNSPQLITIATAEQFKQSEGFDEENQEQVRKLSDPAFARRFHDQFGVRPYWEERRHSPRKGHDKMSSEESGERSAAQRDRQAAIENQEQAQAQAQGQLEGSRIESEAAEVRSGENARMRGPGEMVLGTTLLTGGGVDVKTEDGVDAGDLKDLMVDLNRGHIAYAIVDREDAIVPENQLCAVPWEQFRLQRAEPRPNLLVALPLQKIKDAPGFQDSQWPDMAKLDWDERIHSYYNATPYYMIYGYVRSEGSVDEYGDRSFAQGETHTCTGTIESIDRDAEGQADRRPLTLRMKAKEGQQADQQGGSTATVILAPASFLRSKGLHLQEGQEITVMGWKSDHGGTMRVIAMNVEAGGKSVDLRDRSGQPQWQVESQRQPGQPNPSGER